MVLLSGCSLACWMRGDGAWLLISSLAETCLAAMSEAAMLDIARDR